MQSQFFGPVTQTAGTIDVASGAMILFGTGNILGGTITGTTLDVAGGSDTLRGGLKLTTRQVVFGGGTLTLGGNLAYAGAWSQTAGELDVAGHTMRLSKLTEISSGLVVGPGTLAITGSAQISNTTMSNGVVLQNTGSIGISGSLSLQASSSATPGVINEAAGTFNLADGADVFGSAGVVLNNAGVLEKTAGAGTSLVQVATINAGKVVIGSGKMEFLAPVTGTGTFSIGTGSSLEFSTSVASGSTVSMGASATLLVDPLTTSGGFAGTIAGFAHGDVIDAMSFAYSSTALSFNSARDILTLSEGSFKGTLHFSGSHHASDFFLFSDNGAAGIGHI